MSDARLPRQCFFSELATSLSPRGRPVLRYKDQLKATFKKTIIDRGHKRQERQIDPDGDSPFTPGLPYLKRNGGSKP